GARRSLGALLHCDEGTFPERVRRFGEVRGYPYFLGLGASLLRMGLIDAADSEPARFGRSRRPARASYAGGRYGRRTCPASGSPSVASAPYPPKRHPPGAGALTSNAST